MVNKGLVIIGSTGNEYVWIPCTENTYKREETDWYIENDAETKAIKDELTLVGVTPSKYDLDNEITTTTLNEIVEQVKNEISSIKINGGYYIGRYEVGKESGQAVVKQNKEPYTNVKWSEAYQKARQISSGSSTISYLCSSYAWDTAVNFIQKHSVATNYATSIDNFNGNWKDREVIDKNGKVIKKSGVVVKLNTGVTTSYANICDMGGNVGEFTTELNPNTIESVIVRGGCYDGNTPAGPRWDIIAESMSDLYGFRSTLFFK